MTMARPAIDRVLPRLDTSDPTACWLWPGARTTEGYGHVWTDKHMRPVHRVVYEALVAPVPANLHVDHLCRNRLCVNPAHLEPVPCRTNILRGTGASARHARKTACSKGHPFTTENTFVSWQGYRRCKTCRAIWNQERRQKAMGAA